MEEIRKRLIELNTNASIVSAIVEREHDGVIEILLQTRWKPDRDPEYSGSLEIPAGGVDAYENIYDAVRREVLEETGLEVTEFLSDIQSSVYAPRDDDCFAFVPFCCQQQLRGGIPRIGLVFVCHVKAGEPTPEYGATRDITWVGLEDLEDLVVRRPCEVFTFQLPVLRLYLDVRLRCHTTRALAKTGGRCGANKPDAGDDK